MLNKVKEEEEKSRRVIFIHLKLIILFSKLVLNLYIIFVRLNLSLIHFFIASLSNLIIENLIE